MLLVYKIPRVRYLLQLLAAVVCAANCRRIVCAVIQQLSSSSLQTTIVGPTKVAWCVPSFRTTKTFNRKAIHMPKQTIKKKELWPALHWAIHTINCYMSCITYPQFCRQRKDACFKKMYEKVFVGWIELKTIILASQRQIKPEIWINLLFTTDYVREEIGYSLQVRVWLPIFQQ